MPGPRSARTRTRSASAAVWGVGAQDDAIEHLTQIYAEKMHTEPSVAEARRELGQKTVAEYAKQ